MSEARVYRGRLVEDAWGEGVDVLWLDEDRSWGDPLAKRIADDLDDLGRYLSVRYWTGREPKSREELEHDLVLWQIGEGDARVGHAYSEITGYLWTNEDIEVGGHDLIEELRSHLGKWLHLEIAYAKVAPSATVEVPASVPGEK